MNQLQLTVLALEDAGARLWARLDHQCALRFALLLVPLGFGLLSVLLGQDDNWDLHNYHLYNPYALLNGKIGLDLAPAQWQSYFNPTLDLLYYGLTTCLPAPAVGFIMGYLHGLNFILLLALARQILHPTKAGTAAYRLPLLLSLAGCLGAGFLSELGNTMGDNMTSLFVLGALLLVLKEWPQLAQGGVRGAAVAGLAGLVMGLGTGLKLTNATYALALCLALFALPGKVWLGLRTSFALGTGVLAGIAISAGHWYWKMWQVFGNPLFPQFNDRFHGPLAASIGIGDTGWLPKDWTEKVLWPFIFTFNPKRVIELPLIQLIWPMLYVAFLVLAGLGLRAAILRKPGTDPMPPRTRFLMIFFALSYVGWLNLFGIYRYLIPLELLAPIVFWLVLHRLMPMPFARGVAAYGLLLAALAIVPFATWGHAKWSWASFAADVPVIEHPKASMVFTVHGDPPMGWLVPFFPKTLAFVALGSGFPESQGYRDRVAAMMVSRDGPLYVMLQADRHPPDQGRSEDELRTAQENNRIVLAKAQSVLHAYGLTLDSTSCKPYEAFAGKNRWTYQLCNVVK